MGEAVKLKVIKINGTMELEIQLILGLNIQSRLLRCRRPTTTGGWVARKKTVTLYAMQGEKQLPQLINA